MDENSLGATCSEQKVREPTEEAVTRFKRICRFYTLFHLGFIMLAALEFMVLFCFSLFTKSAALAFSIAGIFLTGFSYFVLLFYYQAKKPEQLQELKEAFLKKCSLPQDIYHLVHLLEGQEYRFYRLPSFLNALNPALEKFSSWSHWKETHVLKERLLISAIRKQIEQVKLDPTDLEAHGCLATAYLQLARIYKDPRTLFPDKAFSWISPQYAEESMISKFQQAAERAIQEYLILDAYAPGELWTQARLAAIYRDMGKAEEEMACYERMLSSAPDDHEVLYRLGILYFEEGQTAKALRIYETLKASGDEKASHLITYYDHFL